MRLVCPSRYRPTFPCGVWLVAFAELTFHVTTVGLLGLDPQAAAEFVTPAVWSRQGARDHRLAWHGSVRLPCHPKNGAPLLEPSWKAQRGIHWINVCTSCVQVAEGRLKPQDLIEREVTLEEGAPQLAAWPWFAVRLRVSDGI